MDVKAILKDMVERCEKDDNFKQLVENNFGEALKSCGVDSVAQFRQLLENDFGEALKSCGVDSVAQFIQAVKNEGSLPDEALANVSGGQQYSSAATIEEFSSSLGITVNGMTIGGLATVLEGMSALSSPRAGN